MTDININLDATTEHIKDSMLGEGFFRSMPLSSSEIKQLVRDANILFLSLDIDDDTLENELSSEQKQTLQMVMDDWGEAAELGHAGAMYNTAILHRRGLGFEQSDSEAFAWLTRAAKLRSKSAQSNLGYFYQHGIGTSVNLNKAMLYYTMAANEFIEAAMHNLGVMHYFGIGVPQDTEVARGWFVAVLQQACILFQPPSDPKLILAFPYSQHGAGWTWSPQRLVSLELKLCADGADF